MNKRKKMEVAIYLMICAGYAAIAALHAVEEHVVELSPPEQHEEVSRRSA